MIRRRLGLVARSVLMGLGARGLVPARRVVGAPVASAVPVVMCLWNRPDRLEAVLDGLAAQQSDRPVRLMLWNNQRRDRARYAEVLRRRAPEGALASVELVQSPINVGGIARFYLLARLRRTGFAGPVILLDDDQEIAPTFVAALLAAFAPRTVHGVWAWTQGTGYWDRTPATGDDATYVGTGGSVLDASIVDDRRFFTALPLPYLFLEDIWMNAVARRLGWTLAHVDAGYTFVDEEVGQHHTLADAKAAFFDYLRSPESDRAWAAARR
ncbi:glycosyltransferase [Herbiconiux sp. VKM Ac-1786]|uniref:glycosyltransferase n=1 Tax=Herbiconiux sp. VKM Ac-1786 TaxID=2783824 RepID=UPI00188B17B7|nr:glycosyltransferase [Herbiconiux sp. VKM Ac-1786]MBF4573489.1 glycosyltransferase [Herbiconiux sp. VKM Ac-1786]